jgi:Protein of unknown function (DUF3800)
MFIFLDESGDAGFKFNQGSSEHFVVALVIFDDPLDAEETAHSIKRLRVQLKMHEKFEFKFGKLDDFRCSQFFEAMRDMKFRVRVMVVDKRNLYNESLITNKDSFYNYFIAEVLKHHNGEISGAKLRVDGSGDSTFKNAFKTFLRQKLEVGIIDNCKFVDSSSDSLIQLADMISGAVYRAHHSILADRRFLEIIQHKIEDLWLFG